MKEETDTGLKELILTEPKKEVNSDGMPKMDNTSTMDLSMSTINSTEKVILN